MWAIMLVKVGYTEEKPELSKGSEFATKIREIVEQINNESRQESNLSEIEDCRIFETLGEVDFLILYKAKSVEAANRFSTEIRKIGAVDSETLVGIEV